MKKTDLDFYNFGCDKQIPKLQNYKFGFEKETNTIIFVIFLFNSNFYLQKLLFPHTKGTALVILQFL